MIYLFFGENIAASRNALVKLKGKYKREATTVLTDYDFSFFAEACEARSLFAKRSLVVMEFDNPSSLPKEDIFFEYLEQLPESTDLAFWVNGKVRKNSKFYKQVEKVGEVVEFAKEEEKPFPFLDALAQRKFQKTYQKLFELRTQGKDEFYLLQMIGWKMSTIFRAKDGVKEGLSPFVYRSAKKQSANFSQEELVSIFRYLAWVDLKMKTGGDSEMLFDQLVYFIAFGE
ncbi:MAG: DNA polymerase III subunit delta [Patescibacteria group bacterium]